MLCVQRVGAKDLAVRFCGEVRAADCIWTRPTAADKSVSAIRLADVTIERGRSPKHKHGKHNMHEGDKTLER